MQIACTNIVDTVYNSQVLENTACRTYMQYPLEFLMKLTPSVEHDRYGTTGEHHNEVWIMEQHTHREFPSNDLFVNIQQKYRILPP